MKSGEKLLNSIKLSKNVATNRSQSQQFNRYLNYEPIFMAETFKWHRYSFYSIINTVNAIISHAMQLIHRWWVGTFHGKMGERKYFMYTTISAPFPFRSIDICVSKNFVILFSTPFNKCADAILNVMNKLMSFILPAAFPIYAGMEAYTLSFSLSLSALHQICLADYNDLHWIQPPEQCTEKMQIDTTKWFGGRE